MQRVFINNILSDKSTVLADYIQRFSDAEIKWWTICNSLAGLIVHHTISLSLLSVCELVRYSQEIHKDD